MRLRLIALALVLAGCSSLPNFVSGPAVEYNALSGREGSNGPVLVVKIDDTAPAHPQIGLEKADVIYIEQVEGGLTRLAAVFSSVLPEKIGPVRSARISDIDIFAQYGKVAFAYSGAQTKMRPLIAAANWIDLGAEREPASIYSRDESRTAPTNMILNPTALLERAKSRGSVPVNASSIGWTFGDLPPGGRPIESVEVKWPASKYTVTWNGNSFRLSQDGRPEVSDVGTPYSPSTLVIQLVQIHPSEFHDRHGGVTPKSEVIGTGKALVLRDGQLFETTWSRPSATSPTTWTLADGKAMTFSRGQVWVLLADAASSPTITWAPKPK